MAQPKSPITGKTFTKEELLKQLEGIYTVRKETAFIELPIKLDSYNEVKKKV